MSYWFFNKFCGKPKTGYFGHFRSSTKSVEEPQFLNQQGNAIDGTEREFDLKEVSEALLRASETERMIYEISPSGYGIHWTLTDEDLSVDGLLGIVHQPEFIVAKLEGERKYQTMVRKWITERLRHEAQIALRLSEMPLKEVAAVLEEQLVSS